MKTSVLTMEKFSTNWPVLLGKELAIIKLRVTNSVLLLKQIWNMDFNSAQVV